MHDNNKNKNENKVDKTVYYTVVEVGEGEYTVSKFIGLVLQNEQYHITQHDECSCIGYAMSRHKPQTAAHKHVRVKDRWIRDGKPKEICYTINAKTHRIGAYIVTLEGYHEKT